VLSVGRVLELKPMKINALELCVLQKTDLFLPSLRQWNISPSITHREEVIYSSRTRLGPISTANLFVAVLPSIIDP